MTFAATIVTLYHEMFPGPLGVSLVSKALDLRFDKQAREDLKW